MTVAFERPAEDPGDRPEIDDSDGSLLEARLSMVRGVPDAAGTVAWGSAVEVLPVGAHSRYLALRAAHHGHLLAVYNDNPIGGEANDIAAICRFHYDRLGPATFALSGGRVGRDVGLGVSPDGLSVVASWEEDAPERHLRYRMSTDGGETWGLDRTALASTGKSNLQDPSIDITHDHVFLVGHPIGGPGSIRILWAELPAGATTLAFRPMTFDGGSESVGEGWFPHIDARQTRSGETTDLVVVWSRTNRSAGGLEGRGRMAVGISTVAHAASAAPVLVEDTGTFPYHPVAGRSLRRAEPGQPSPLRVPGQRHPPRRSSRVRNEDPGSVRRVER